MLFHRGEFSTKWSLFAPVLRILHSGLSFFIKIIDAFVRLLYADSINIERAPYKFTAYHITDDTDPEQALVGKLTAFAVLYLDK